MASYYEVLGVERDATEEQIKASYRRLARKYHPDVSEEPDAEARFKEIQAAHDVLMDKDRRRVYDETGREDNTHVLEAQAREGVAQYVLKWIETCLTDWTGHEYDLRNWLQAQIDVEIQQATSNKATGEKLLAKTEHTLKRLKYKGTGRDTVRYVLEQRIENLNKGIAVAQDNITRLTLAHQFVNDYELEQNTHTSPTATGYFTMRLYSGR